MGKRRTVIYTQDVNRDAIVSTLIMLAPGATLTPGIGIWKDEQTRGGMMQEKSLTITIIHNDDWLGLEPLVAWLKDKENGNGQTEVMYETFASETVVA